MPSPVRAVASIAALLLAVGACSPVAERAGRGDATTGSTAARGAARQGDDRDAGIGPAESRLRLLAERERRHPVPVATDDDAPWNLAFAGAGRPTLREAKVSLDAAEAAARRTADTEPTIDAFAARPLRGDDAPASTPPADAPRPEASDAPAAVPPVADEQAATDALRLYAAGRAATAAGDPDAALGLLERAADLLPDNAEIQRALGDANIEAGLGASAVFAFARAAELGLEEPRPLAVAGVDALRRGQLERAAAFFARAVRSDVPEIDTSVHAVAWAGLGEALLDLGYARAGATALAKGLSGASRLRVPTRLPAEYATLRRRESDLWLLAGDTLFALDDLQAAADAYAEAAVNPSIDPAAVLARRVRAAVGLGRPASAALVLVEAVRNNRGLLDDRALRLIDGIARSGRLGGAFPAAVREAYAALEFHTPTIDLLADRVATAATGDGARRRAAFAAWRTHPQPSPRAAFALARDAAWTFDPADEAALVTAARDLTETRPLWYRSAAAAVLLRAAEPAALLSQAQRAATSPAGRLLHAALLLELGRAAEVDLPPLLADAASTDPQLANAAAAAADAAGATAALVGQWHDADLAVAAMDRLHATDPALAVPRARLLWTLQRYDDARVALAALAPPTTADAALLAADAARQTRDIEDSLAAVRLALEADPFDERAHAARLATLATAGETSREAVAEAARDLRAAVPSSRVVRLLALDELLQRRLFDEARVRLEGLVDEDPLDAQAADRLVALAAAARTADPAAARALADRAAALAAAHPASAPLARAHALALAVTDRGDEALAAAEAFAARTGSALLAPVAEQILRDTLKRPDDAAARRLARLDHPHRSLAESVELAGVLVTQDPVDAADVTRAASVLTQAAPPAVQLGADQATAAGSIAARVAALALAASTRPQATDGDAPALPTEPWATPTLDVLRWAALRRVPMSPALFDLTIRLADDAAEPLDNLFALADRAVAQHPQLARPFLQRVGELARARSDGSWRAAAEHAAANAFTADNASLNEPWLIEWFRLIALEGSVEDARALLLALANADAGEQALNLISGGEDPTPDASAALADLAYLMSNVAQGSGQQDRSNRFLELTLQLDPEHVWANNDLGYRMLLDRESPDLAEPLILRAFAQRPDRASIIDTIGWLRYHQRRLLDDDRGEGAITLLKRAVEALGADDDGTVADHLADAYYLADRKTDALRTWRAAEQRARAELESIRRAGGATSSRAAELTAFLEAVRGKLSAALGGKDPAIAEPIAPPAPAAN